MVTILIKLAIQQLHSQLHFELTMVYALQFKIMPMQLLILQRDQILIIN